MNIAWILTLKFVKIFVQQMDIVLMENVCVRKAMSERIVVFGYALKIVFNVLIQVHALNAKVGII